MTDKMKITKQIKMNFAKSDWTLTRLVNLFKRNYEPCHIIIDDLTANAYFKITIEPIKVSTTIDD